MIHLDLEATERNTLMETLESSLSDMSYEIADTASFVYREKLKAKRDVRNKILQAVKQAHESG
jgi:hypothetical protein